MVVSIEIQKCLPVKERDGEREKTRDNNLFAPYTKTERGKMSEFYHQQSFSSNKRSLKNYWKQIISSLPDKCFSKKSFFVSVSPILKHCKCCMFFFNVGPPKEDIFLNYLIHVHITHSEHRL